ncbi:MAG: hypothetical protein GY953_42595 [bacterium]|nr:hypothetical protein [bacterium]
MIWLWFRDGLSGYRNRPPYATRYPVLEATFPHLIQRDWDSPRSWLIMIYGVPRQHRHTVRSKLEAEGLARAKEWLQTNADVTGCEGSVSLALVFDEIQQILEVEESDHRGPQVVS